MRNGFPGELEISGIFWYYSVLFSLNILFTHWMWSHRHKQFVLTLWSVSPPSLFFFTVEHLYGITLLNVYEWDFVSCRFDCCCYMPLNSIFKAECFFDLWKILVYWQIWAVCDIVEIFSEIIDCWFLVSFMRRSRVLLFRKHPFVVWEK